MNILDKLEPVFIQSYFTKSNKVTMEGTKENPFWIWGYAIPDQFNLQNLCLYHPTNIDGYWETFLPFIYLQKQKVKYINIQCLQYYRKIKFPILTDLLSETYDDTGRLEISKYITI